MIKIVTILGARPQFIKASILSKLFKSSSDFKETIVHTGQHYDFTMSQIFFQELKIPKPHFNLGVQSKLHGSMTAKMLIKIEELLIKIRPDFTIVYGDTNSTLAGALASRKLNIPVIHIEAGLRSFNPNMPEEVNRILTDHSSTYLFTPSKLASFQLLKENFHKDNIFNVGDTMLDVYLNHKPQIKKISKKKFKDLGKYILVTIHRAENTMSEEILKNIYLNLELLSQNYKIIFPMHPRTEKILRNLKLYYYYKSTFNLIKPIGYIETMSLLEEASLLITDSGGMQKESFYCKVPCLTVRNQTEWPETVQSGWNRKTKIKNKLIYKNALKSISSKGKKTKPYGSGNASLLIMKKIRYLYNKVKKYENSV